MMFTVNGYYNGFHLIESFAFKALRSEVDLTLLPSGSIRQTGDRVFLSEIVPQSDIMDAVKELADEVTEAADAQSDIVDAVKELADEVAEAADAQIDIVDAVKELGDEVTEAYLDRIRRRYIAEKYKKRDELAEVARKLALETQQRDWEKQQKEKKEQRKLKKAQKSKKEEQKKKKK
ncbi:nucleolar protein 58 [Raphanus sativus]|uniref:Nucleolar protein 58 n=1 Tax=Raphanus sativus TaxID=3726 RepID=A0A6J0JNJ4_RAPSA|nr:nucleolar protein 58 [Raphanus sativus]XP_018436597.1 nucleolar protein 58 [Raphanus sativus]